MNFKKLFRFLRKNYLLSVFFAVIVFVCGYVAIQFIFSKPYEVYAKIELGQGLWWASFEKPNLWFAKGIKVGDKEYNLLGQPTAEVLNVTYYPFFSYNTGAHNDQYDIYLIVKLRASYNKRVKKFVYNRSDLAVGSAININLSSSEITGSIIALSRQPIINNYVVKTITLTDFAGYRKDNSYMYDNIDIGGTYFNGQETVFQVLSKSLQPMDIVSPDLYGNITDHLTNVQQNIVVKARIKLEKKGNQYFFGDGQGIKIGAPLGVSTSNYTFEGFQVSNIE